MQGNGIAKLSLKGKNKDWEINTTWFQDLFWTFINYKCVIVIKKDKSMKQIESRNRPIHIQTVDLLQRYTSNSRLHENSL
jgi:hypothetical protein